MADALVTAANIGRGELVDIAIVNGLIASITPAAEQQFATGVVVHDAAGHVVIPGFVEPHLHLDKAYLGPGPADGGLAGAIAHTATLKAGFTEGDVRSRAVRAISAAVACGTTAIRAQTEVDPGVGLLGIRVLSQLAEELASVVRLQLAIFPQEGIEARPGTLDLMREALRLPGTIVGACPYVEKDVVSARRHINTVLDLAVEHGVPADLHLDFADDTTDERFALAGYLASATIARGLQGRVTIGHATSLASLGADDRARVLEALATARIAVVLLPATDLYLMGRRDTVDIRRGVAPLTALWDAGVATATSSNNLRNAFTPTGLADPLDTALLLARVSHLSSEADFGRMLGLVTSAGARILEPDAIVGIEVGARADLVILDSMDAASVVLDQPQRRLVLTAGAVAYEQHTSRTWASPLDAVRDSR